VGCGVWGVFSHPSSHTPHPSSPAGLLSVAVLRHGAVASAAPPLTVSRGGFLIKAHGYKPETEFLRFQPLAFSH